MNNNMRIQYYVGNYLFLNDQTNKLYGWLSQVETLCRFPALDLLYLPR